MNPKPRAASHFFITPFLCIRCRCRDIRVQARLWRESRKHEKKVELSAKAAICRTLEQAKPGVRTHDACFGNFADGLFNRRACSSWRASSMALKT